MEQATKMAYEHHDIQLKCIHPWTLPSNIETIARALEFVLGRIKHIELIMEGINPELLRRGDHD